MKGRTERDTEEDTEWEIEIEKSVQIELQAIKISGAKIVAGK